MKRNRQKEVEQKVRVDMYKAEMRSVWGGKQVVDREQE